MSLQAKSYSLKYSILLTGITLILVAGCHFRKQTPAVTSAPCVDCSASFTEIEYPDLCDQSCEDTTQFLTHSPPTIDNFYEQESWPLSLEEAIEIALSNSQVLQRLGGRVLSGPQGTATVFDPALIETDPNRSAEAALSAFDAQFLGSANFSHLERQFANPIAAQFGGNVSNTGTYRAGLSKFTATGSQFTLRNLTDYSFNNSIVNFIPSTWTTIMQAEWRQPLGRGYGTAVNRIAGPNAVPGSYNGVLIGRIRGDIALADFEAAVRDLVRDVEAAYWELYFSYRALDINIRTRDSSRLIWVNRNNRVEAGISRPDDEAQTRQSYYNFSQQVVDSLSGNASGTTGVLGSERQLRRLLGLLNTDGRIIRPVTEPTIAPISFDWDQSQQSALANRVELRRQKWSVRQRELELFAARKLNRWRFDFVSSYGAKGFGDNLFGSRSRPQGSAFEDLFSGDLDDWALGFELQGPVGNRQGHLAIRNAELQLTREKTILREQQRQVTLDLNAAITEVARAYQSIKNNFNTRQAVLDELGPKFERYEAGEEDVFFLLDAQTRAANSETAFHRSVVDYNLALQNYVFTTGSLLEHYNIHLVEGGWNDAAQADAMEKPARFRYRSPDTSRTDLRPISAGPVDQSTDLIIYNEAEGAVEEVAPDTPPAPMEDAPVDEAAGE